MLATDPLIHEHFPQYLPSEDELAITVQMVATKPELDKQLKEIIAVDADVTATLRRFCWQAKQDDLKGAACAQEAVKLLEQCVQKRQQLGLDSILGSSPGFPEEYWESFIKTVPQTYHGLGRRGQPVMLIRFGGIDPARFRDFLAAGKEYSRGDVNAAVLCFLRCEECLFQRTVPQESRRIGHLTDRVLLMVDLWGMGLGHISFARDFLAVAVKQTVLLYPETLDRVLVLNAAWSFARLLWPILKQLLHPVTQRKVEIVDASGTREKLLEHLEPDKIPSCFGGDHPGVHMGRLL
ncbi:unnamed protein product [Effrenium voratum]|uniref:CRAL-TRIO domain-containing protein n=1 Tax=Effrenium voratum TaxID=2562239 RepID=A0AA36I2J7_9DINO|nr:unnamed protein product [Effrenium voratum]CAJ1433486.1 unnamed protein product [Effrenium voratum]